MSIEVLHQLDVLGNMPLARVAKGDYGFSEGHPFKERSDPASPKGRFCAFRGHESKGCSIILYLHEVMEHPLLCRIEN